MPSTITSYTFFRELESLPFVEEIWLYGSRARQDNKERSDIDLAIVCPKATNMEWLSIIEIIDHADTLLEIDCVRLDSLGNTNSLKDNILTEGISLYKSHGKH